jgi:hypothetical protein
MLGWLGIASVVLVGLFVAVWRGARRSVHAGKYAGDWHPTGYRITTDRHYDYEKAIAGKRRAAERGDARQQAETGEKVADIRSRRKGA